MDLDNDVSSDRDEDYRNELFRRNCVEIVSSEVDSVYAEHSISLVDNILSSEEEEEYIDYVCFGRNGMPNWKAYYDIRNLVETLEDVDGLENKNVKNILNLVERKFLMILFSRVGITDESLSNPCKKDVFNILRKLEFFYPKEKELIEFLLKVDKGSIKYIEIEHAYEQYNTILSDESYFLDKEKAVIEVMLYYFLGKEEPLVYTNAIKDRIQRYALNHLVSFLDKVKHIKT